MLSAWVLHVALGVQSLIVPAWRAPVTWPTYCVRLFWVGSVSVQSAKYAHCRASACRNGIEPNPAPPTAAHVRFSNANTTTDV